MVAAQRDTPLEKILTFQRAVGVAGMSEHGVPSRNYYLTGEHFSVNFSRKKVLAAKTSFILIPSRRLGIGSCGKGIVLPFVVSRTEQVDVQLKPINKADSW